jgi:DNA anti-recombination protein RmuC
VDAYCRSRQVIAVSPNTLYAHLSVIAMGLRGLQIEENARLLAANLAGMRKQLDTFSQHFGKVGSHLKNAQQSYTEADKRFERASNTLNNLLTSGETGLRELDDAQGTLELSQPTAAKKSA